MPDAFLRLERSARRGTRPAAAGVLLASLLAAAIACAAPAPDAGGYYWEYSVQDSRIPCAKPTITRVWITRDRLRAEAANGDDVITISGADAYYELNADNRTYVDLSPARQRQLRAQLESADDSAADPTGDSTGESTGDSTDDSTTDSRDRAVASPKAALSPPVRARTALQSPFMLVDTGKRRTVAGRACTLLEERLRGAGQTVRELCVVDAATLPGGRTVASVVARLGAADPATSRSPLGPDSSVDSALGNRVPVYVAVYGPEGRLSESTLTTTRAERVSAGLVTVPDDWEELGPLEFRVPVREVVGDDSCE